MAADWQAQFLERQRKEYQEDSFKWLYEEFVRTTKRINNESEWQVNETKSFVQNAAEGVERRLVATRDRLFICVAVIAIVALASAGLWIGVAGIALFLVVERWLSWSADKQDYRLDLFRRRFRELLKKTDERDMLAEDKAFLQEHADSILFPYAIADTGADSCMCRFSEAAIYVGHGRERVSGADLEHVETLYREYCGGPVFGHPHDLDAPRENCTECKLGLAARRVRNHIEGALAKFEGEIKQWREALVTKIDGSNPEGAILTRDFQEDFRQGWLPYDEGTEIRTLFDWLRDKDRWTFDQADKVLEVCRKKIGSSSLDAYARIYDKLSREMGAAAAHGGLWDGWKHYDQGRNGLVKMERALMDVRRILKRHNPEAMFRELSEGAGWVLMAMTLESFKNYGYDRTMVDKEMRTARKVIAKEHGAWDTWYEKELQAAKAFAWVEQAIENQRNKECKLWIGEKP